MDSSCAGNKRDTRCDSVGSAPALYSDHDVHVCSPAKNMDIYLA